MGLNRIIYVGLMGFFKLGFTGQANPTYMSHLQQNAVIGKCFKSHLKTRATVEVEGRRRREFNLLLLATNNNNN